MIQFVPSPLGILGKPYLLSQIDRKDNAPIFVSHVITSMAVCVQIPISPHSSHGGVHDGDSHLRAEIVGRSVQSCTVSKLQYQNIFSGSDFTDDVWNVKRPAVLRLELRVQGLVKFLDRKSV